MKLSYCLDENDYLQHLLYTASKSKLVIGKRRQTRIVFPAIYLALALYLFSQKRFEFGSVIAALAVLWYFLYPIWERRYYRNHYKKVIEEKLSYEFGKVSSIELSSKFMLATDLTSESKIHTSELSSIDEIGDYFFLRLNGNQSFIIPKKKITDTEEVKINLQRMAADLKIPFLSELNWKWK